MKLIIVESPHKAHLIQGFLGDNYKVLASKGHITELAKGGKFGLGVDVNNKFKPRYILSNDKIDVLDELMDAAKECEEILIASDPDREGEAIAWHLKERLEDVGKPIRRVVFNKIKKPTVLSALKSPRDIDMDLVHAQEARRILDRLVGFMASPFLMNFFGNKLSAGRVQSVVTRMIIDRENEIETFIPEEFWTINANLSNGQDSFVAKYIYKISDAKTAEDLKIKLLDKNSIFYVSNVSATTEAKYPVAPLITSTLQRIMSKDHGFSADRTMKAAQSLYENGYCSYIRTDSVRVGDEVVDEVRQWLNSNNYKVPAKPYQYKNKDASQDAHECIYPTELTLLPNKNMAIIDPDEKIVYEKIWKYFIASQMEPALYDTLKVSVKIKGDSLTELRASGKALKSPGYLDILSIVDNSSIDIPLLKVNDVLKLTDNKSVKVERKQTQPPPRYSEDKLIKELESRSIGRPSTFAELISKICNRNYVEKKGNVFHATDLGIKITTILVEYFSFMDLDFSSNLEKYLDDIAMKKNDKLSIISEFYNIFSKELFEAYSKLDFNKITCDKCNNFVTKNKGSNGIYYKCIDPRCKRTFNENSREK